MRQEHHYAFRSWRQTDGAGAAVGDNVGDVEDLINAFARTTLTATTLADGGAGQQHRQVRSSAAENLWLQGSTLKYVGGATSTDRLFTVGTAGGTIDASGTGALVFGNTGELAIDIAEDRAGMINGGYRRQREQRGVRTGRLQRPHVRAINFDTSDLVAGDDEVCPSPQVPVRYF